MKGVKWFVKFGVALLTLFIVSAINTENINAVDFTVSVEPTGNSYTVGSDLRCTLDYQGQITTITANIHGECNIPIAGTTSPTYVRNVFLNRNISVTEGNYYSFFFGYENGDTGASDVLWNLNTANDAWTIFRFEEVTNDRMKAMCYTWHLSGQTSYECGGLDSFESWNSKYFMVTLRANTTGNIMPILGNLNGSPRSFMIVYGGQISMSTIFEFKPGAMESMNEKDDQDRQALENQSSDTESESNDLGSDAESASSSIMSNISSIIGAFSTGATDCVISVKTGANGALNLNNMNVCQAPQSILTMIHNISGIVITIAVLWVSYSIIMSFLSIYESFLGAGGKA